jgi:hypothetical protein
LSLGPNGTCIHRILTKAETTAIIEAVEADTATSGDV